MQILAMIGDISDPRMKGKVHHPLSTIYNGLKNLDRKYGGFVSQ